MTVILAIDPGPEQSGVAAWDGERVLARGVAPNLEVISFVALMGSIAGGSETEAELVIEHTPPYCLRRADGSPYVPSQVPDTAYQAGMMAREWEAHTLREAVRFSRRDVLKHLRAASRKPGAGSQDSQVVKALTARLGPKGTKREPGITYGVTSHAWQALGLAVTYHDLFCTVPF